MEFPQARPSALTILWKSLLAGILTLIFGSFAAVGLTIAALMVNAFRHPAVKGGDVGWDLVTMFHGYGVSVLIAMAALFTSGFIVSYWRCVKIRA